MQCAWVAAGITGFPRLGLSLYGQLQVLAGPAHALQVQQSLAQRALVLFAVHPRDIEGGIVCAGGGTIKGAFRAA